MADEVLKNALRTKLLKKIELKQIVYNNDVFNVSQRSSSCSSCDGNWFKIRTGKMFLFRQCLQSYLKYEIKKKTVLPVITPPTPSHNITSFFFCEKTYFRINWFKDGEHSSKHLLNIYFRIWIKSPYEEL